MFEKETIELFKTLRDLSATSNGGWKHSPVENAKIDYFPAHLNESNLINFRRTALSGGTISFPDRPLWYLPQPQSIASFKPWPKGIPFWQKVRGIRDILMQMYRVNKQCKIKMNGLTDNLVGNPCYYLLGHRKVTDFCIRMFYYHEKLKQEFSADSIETIMEIGGGFGGLCEKLISSKEFAIKTYILIDLPENLSLSYYYLSNSGLKVKVAVKEKDLDSINITETEKVVILLAPWLLPKLSRKVDLFINTMSFQHMTLDNLKYYLSEIDRLKVRKLYLVNREGKRDPSDVVMSKYPISSAYELVKKEAYPLSNHETRIYSLR